jgi:hypothetical protein
MPALLDRPSQNVWSLWSHGNGKVATTIWTPATTKLLSRLKAESLTQALYQ